MFAYELPFGGIWGLSCVPLIWISRLAEVSFFGFRMGGL